MLSQNTKIQESHLEILITKSKTDQHKEGNVFYIFLYFQNVVQSNI